MGKNLATVWVYYLATFSDFAQKEDQDHSIRPLSKYIQNIKENMFVPSLR
jgi:hypothetical protein